MFLLKALSIRLALIGPVSEAFFLMFVRPVGTAVTCFDVLTISSFKDCTSVALYSATSVCVDYSMEFQLSCTSSFLCVNVDEGGLLRLLVAN